MCGFVIAIGNFSENELKHATHSISYRGPDETNFYFDDSIQTKIGFNRLSIIDIEGGRQPFVSEDKNLIIAFNGEIYNSKELRKEMELSSIRFRTKNSDTEVFLKGYQFWGSQIFNKIDGMFSVGILDKKKNKLLIARDKFGEKPLYYYLDKKNLIVGSELKIFKSFKKLKLNLDTESLKKYFIFNFIPSPNTLYKEVKKAKNSNYYEFSLHNFNVKESEYYNLLSKKNLSIANPLEYLDDLMRESVKTRLVTDQKIGLFLSGGIDSSLIAYYAKELNQDIDSFTVSVKGKTFNEIEKAKQLSEYLKIKNFSIDLDESTFNKVYSNIIGKLDEPLGAPTFVPTYMVSQLASQSVKSVLSGDGGDEIFGGYDIFKYLKLINFSRNILGKNVSSILELFLKFFPISKNNLSFDFKVRRFLRGMKYSQKYQNTMFLSSISIKDLEEIFNEKIVINDFFGDLEIFDKKLDGFNYFDKTLLYYVQYYLPDLVCARADRAGMLNSLEIRSPFLNPKILEFVLNRPNHEKESMFETKKMLRNLLSTKIPKNQIDRDKTGFTFPIQEWLDVKNINYPNILNKNKIDIMKKDHISGKTEFRNFFYSMNALNF